MKDLHQLKEDLRKWFSKTDPEGGWKRINSKGEAIGPCAREPGEPKPKCMSNEKRAKLSKKERASAVASKRKHDPNPERKGEPINVSNFGKGKISEDMENLEEKNVPTSPEKWAQAKSQAKAKFDVYPSAYANGWAAKKYKAMGGGWKSVSEESQVSESKMKKASEVFKNIRFAKMDPNHEKAGPFSTDDEEHNAVSQKEYEQQVQHVKKRSMQEVKEVGDEQIGQETPAGLVKKGNKTVMTKPLNQEAKDEQEYGYEGDMALNQLATLTRCAEMIKDVLKPDTDLPEWVQSKITLATDYIVTAADYLHSEMKEEVRKSDIPAYLRKQQGEKPLTVADVKAPRKDSISAAANLQKLRNEEVVQEGQMKRMATDKEETARLSKVPFDGPYTKVKNTVTDKSGAKHTPMSRAKDLARTAMKKQADKMKMPVKESVKESRKAEIVKQIMKKKKDPKDKFEPNPTLNSQVQKIDNVT